MLSKIVLGGDFLVLKLFPGVCAQSATQASQSAAPARKSAFMSSSSALPCAEALLPLAPQIGHIS